MSNIPACRAYALKQPIDFERYRDLQVTADIATKPVRQYRVSLTTWSTDEVWVEGIDEHDAKEAAWLLWGTYDRAFTQTAGGIHDLSVLESRKF